jgi:hypothetical protein
MTDLHLPNDIASTRERTRTVSPTAPSHAIPTTLPTEKGAIVWCTKLENYKLNLLLEAFAFVCSVCVCVRACACVRACVKFSVLAMIIHSSRSLNKQMITTINRMASQMGSGDLPLRDPLEGAPEKGKEVGDRGRILR